MLVRRSWIWVSAVLFTAVLVFYAAWPVVARSAAFLPQPISNKERNPAHWGMDREVDEAVFTTSDGIRLHGWWFHARTVGACGGTVIYFHGNQGNLLSRTRVAQNLAADGFHVLVVDYRGYGASEGSPSEVGLYRDADAAHDWVRRVMQIQADRVLVVGHSIGAAVAAELASRKSVAGVVLLSPFTSFPGATRARLSMVPQRIADWGGIRFATVEHVSRVKHPVLVLRGTLDRFTLRSDARRVFDAVPGPKRWLDVEAVGHNDLSSSAVFRSAFRTFAASALRCPTEG